MKKKQERKLTMEMEGFIMEPLNFSDYEVSFRR